MTNMAGDYKALTYTEMRDQNLFTDAVVKSSSGREWNVHKVVMSRVGKFFSNAFTFTSFSGTLDLGVSDEIVKVIVDLAYEGTCVVNVENVLEVLSVALMYQLESLIEICVTFLLKTISSENAVDLKVYVRDSLDLFKTFTNGALIQVVDNFITRNFSDLDEEDYMYNLSIEELEDFVKSDDLNIADEDLLNFVLKYITFHKLDHEEAKQLLSNVRLGLISTQKLQQIADENETFRSVETREELNAVHLPRYPRNIALVVQDEDNGTSEIFNIRKNEWKEVQLSEIVPDVIVGNILYSIDILDGAEVGWTKIKSFDLKSGQSVIEKHSQFPNDFKFPYSELLAWNGGVLAFMENGDNDESVAYYNPGENSWVTFPPRKGATSVVVNETLFSIGGYTEDVEDVGDSDTLKCIEYLDKDTMTWILCGFLKENEDPFRAKVVDGKVYVFEMRKEYAECFQPIWEDGRMSLVWFPKIKLPGIYQVVEISVVDNKILFSGGERNENEDFNQKECHIFSPRTGEWSRVADLNGSNSSGIYGFSITIDTSELEVKRIQQLCDGDLLVFDE